ncbi:ADP,ATP carrier protein [Rickettsia canadensis str. McKiel]|uniref:ADP,ATP carrier protein n=1 Tax=Rickettsia canadensis (strain McKiel) TaxID=293613 RepID=A8EYI6_RICCK|nr:nucleotide exchange transporter Tlc3 [Rickettsia canadensis]ABV73419.1 ADP,ATP carrier protein [Rickettsia canadensis str. McKiel]
MLSPKIFFEKVKEIIWPIERNELKLFIPMALMMLCILFNFGALRSIKDSLVVPSMGAEIISFLKLWLVLPSCVIFTILYVKLSNKLNFEYIFYVIVGSFLLFFLLFAYIIYPNQDIYHPNDEMINNLIASYPNFKWFIKIGSKWSYALMYIFSELWSAVVINLMFWQFANHIFDTSKAKRFYPVLGMVGNIGLIIAGSVLVFFSSGHGIIDSELLPDSFNSSYQNAIMLQPIMSIIVTAGIIAILLFRIINRLILTDSINVLDVKKVTAKTKTKLSVIESIKLVIQSKYIGRIALLIICYGLLINIVEGPWKAKIKALYPNTVDYVNFMGRFNIWMGISCVTFMVIGSNILRRLGWLISALLTPIMLSITGLIFFIFIIFIEEIPSYFGVGDFNLLYAAIIVGAIQNILSKSSKYSLFDSTKEIAYIPLSLELRTKGKAAVEVIGTKFGKSLGAFIQSLIFIIIPNATFDSIIIYLLVIFIVMMSLWIWNVIKLNKEYIELCT